MSHKNIKRLKHSALIKRDDDEFMGGSLTCTVDGIEDKNIQLHKGMALDYIKKVKLDEAILKIGSEMYSIECTQTKNSKKGYLSSIVIFREGEIFPDYPESHINKNGYINRKGRTRKITSESINKKTELFIKKIIRENLPRLPLHWY